MTLNAPKPNFFIVGAPKCGTTAMYHYLKQHPEVFLPALKEPHYFATDFQERGYLRDPRVYYDLFARARTPHIGEASVWYLFSIVAAAHIRQELGPVKIVAMLRNPVDFLHSLHSQSLYSGQENLRDFMTALDAEDARRGGQQWPRQRFDKKLLYRDIVDFAPQLQRYFDVFGRASVHVILFDDLAANPAAAYRDCCSFLGLKDEGQPDLAVVNTNKNVRNLKLQHFLRKPPPTVQRAVRLAIPRWVRAKTIQNLQRANMVTSPRAKLSAENRAELAERFRPQVERLEKLLDRDLRHWYSGEDRSPLRSVA